MSEQDNRGNIVLKWLREEYKLGRKQAIDECLEILDNSFNRAVNTGSYVGAGPEAVYRYGIKKTTILGLKKKIEKLKSEGE